MIDFTDMPTRKKTYAGANGGKIAVIYDGEQYMLKFPPHPKRNKEMSYTHSCIKCNIGCNENFSPILSDLFKIAIVIQRGNVV